MYEQGLLAAEHSVGPQTGQCRDPGSTIADFERLVIAESATEEGNLERTAQAPSPTFEQLTYPNRLTLNALVELLTEKSALSKPEILERVKKLQSETKVSA